MNKIIKYLVFLLLAIILIICYRLFSHNDVESKLLTIIPIANQFCLENHCMVVVSDHSLRSILTDVCDSARIYNSLKGRLDFIKYDYIISFNKLINKVWWSRAGNMYTDNCDYLKDYKVINVEYSDTTNSFYVYQLMIKGEYRHPCG